MDAAPAPPTYLLRPATLADVPALEQLIPLSVRTLQAASYSPAQMEAALGPVFGVDRHLIQDGTYWVATHEGQVVACGGWSRRLAAFGGDAHQSGLEQFLNPAKDAARIRAFFVHPAHARRGLGRRLLQTCEAAAREAGFTRCMLVATLPGEPLYAAHGYAVQERYEVPLPDAPALPVVRMGRDLGSSPEKMVS